MRRAVCCAILFFEPDVGFPDERRRLSEKIHHPAPVRRHILTGLPPGGNVLGKTLKILNDLHRQVHHALLERFLVRARGLSHLCLEPTQLAALPLNASKGGWHRTRTRRRCRRWVL